MPIWCTIEGGRKNAFGDRVHFLVQMDPLPNADERAALAEQGLHLLNYVSGNTYIAWSSVATAGNGVQSTEIAARASAAA